MDVERCWAHFRATGDPEARERLILQYAPLVKYLIGRMAISLPSTLDSEDLVSYGVVGLIDAVERYDPSRGVKFETYAIPRIRGSILDALRHMDLVPRSARARAKEVQNAMVRLERELGRPPEDEEMARALGLDVPALHRAMEEATCCVVSLDGLLDDLDDDDGRRHAQEPADADVDLSRDLEEQELRQEIAGAIRRLPERERLLITLYYYEELTMKEIAAVLGVTESRVCQLHTRAVMLLRTYMMEARRVVVA